MCFCAARVLCFPFDSGCWETSAKSGDLLETEDPSEFRDTDASVLTSLGPLLKRLWRQTAERPKVTQWALDALQDLEKQRQDEVAAKAAADMREMEAKASHTPKPQESDPAMKGQKASDPGKAAPVPVKTPPLEQEKVEVETASCSVAISIVYVWAHICALHCRQTV